MKSEMFARVLRSSHNNVTDGILRSVHLHYPRSIHAEIMTHRVFGRNARSSRAVPVKRMLEEVRTTPFVPWHWTHNQPGMQGEGGWNEKVVLFGSAAQFVDDTTAVSREAAWLHGRDMMCDLAESFADAEYHKQLVNRLVEPFGWIDTLITADQWKNFMHLRDHRAAEPHLRDLSQMAKEAFDKAPVQTLGDGGWHFPYVSDEELGDEIAEWLVDHPETGLNTLEMACRVDSARCARISYTPFDGNPSYERELERFNQLANDDAVHASPMEHQAMATTPENSFGLHGNLRPGWVQFRKTIPNEWVPG